MHSPRPVVARLGWIALGLGLVAGVQLGGSPGAMAETVAGRADERLAAWGITAEDGACEDGAGTGEAPAEPGAAVEVDGIGIVLEKPADSALGSDTVFVRVDAKDGGPLTGALVFVAIRMPSMDHGVSAYPATEVEDGRYRADDVSLGMAGEWLVSVEVIRQARAPIAATYRLDVTES